MTEGRSLTGSSESTQRSNDLAHKKAIGPKFHPTDRQGELGSLVASLDSHVLYKNL